MEAAGVLITPDGLRELADQAEAEANRLREASKAKRIEAVRLRREAEALEGALRFAPPPSEPTPSARAELAGEIAEWLARCRVPKSSSEVAEHCGVSQARARASLGLLVDSGMVARSGLKKKGTRYRILRDGEVNVEPQPFGERWHERVRDEAIRLEVFTIADMREALGDHMSDQTLWRWLNRLVDDGVLSCVREGNRNVYAYEPAEAKAPTRARRLEPLPGRLRGSVVVSGRTERGARREVREVLNRVRKQGAKVKPQKHGYAIEINGEVVTSVPKTASDHRSIANARSALRRGGLDA